MPNPGDAVFQVSDPSRVGFFTGQTRLRSSGMMLEVQFSNGDKSFFFERFLKVLSKDGKSALDQLLAGELGRDADLRRKMTFEKLRGTLSEFIYSMDSAEIDFMPYQYKPVLKFIESPTERLLLADEVGLGKTIEASLVWQELQARRDARRLLILCPKTLATNWRSELRTKFSIPAEIVDVDRLNYHYEELLRQGENTRFALIATYTSARGSSADFEAIRDEEEPRSKMGRMVKAWNEWQHPYFFADLVIFDEAHILRTPTSLTSRTARALANAASGVLCVSATPVNNDNEDLRSLLRILDPGTFESEEIFQQILEGNSPAVRMANALMQTPPGLQSARNSLPALKSSSYIAGSELIPVFEALLEEAIAADARGDAESRAEALVKAQSSLEQLNVLGAYITRTRRKQVKEMPAVRKPMVIPVKLTPMERRFYEAVTSIVRKRLQLSAGRLTNGRSLSLPSISPQLRMASCIPAMVKVYKEGGPDAFIENVIETFAEEDEADDDTLAYKEEMQHLIAEFAAYDFEADDTKFKEFSRILVDPEFLGSDQKIVVFAYFRGTIEYLSRRLNRLGVTNITLHGGVSSQDERNAIIESFRDASGPRILISSEVGSEGINLQFARVVVNYDLPWNPMKVEQRIGRVDRVGQQAKVLPVVHFKVLDTIDGRVFERLYEKLELARVSIGDMEAVLGEEIKALTHELFTQNLTPAQEQALLDQKTNVIIQKARMQSQLEESSSSFEGLSDFVRSQINRSRKLGRYVTSRELHAYVDDFFRLNEMGNVLQWNYQRSGVFKLAMGPISFDKFRSFVAKSQPEAIASQTGSTIVGTFSPEIAKLNQRVEGQRVPLVTHLSPLIRWITDELQSVKLYSAVAMEFKSESNPPGSYAFAVERWYFKGIRTREILAYGVTNLDTGEVFTGDRAEALYLEMLNLGSTWDSPPLAAFDLQSAMHRLDIRISHDHESAESLFIAENQNLATIQLKQVEAHYRHRLRQDEARLQTSVERGSPQAISFAQKLIDKTKERYGHRIDLIKSKLGESAVDGTVSDIAKGIFRII